MAKFVTVGYGSDGRGTKVKGMPETGYVYLVDDNVKEGATIYPAVKHAKSGTIFGTTGVVLGQKRTTSDGRVEDTDLKKDEVSYTATTAQLGIKESRRGNGGKFVGGASPYTESELSLQKIQTRGANILAEQARRASQGETAEIANTEKANEAATEYLDSGAYKRATRNQTFEEYSAKFRQ